MSGASLAGVARAAASRALERAVVDFSQGANRDATLECLVDSIDFDNAVQDVFASSGDADWTDDEEPLKDSS